MRLAPQGEKKAEGADVVAAAGEGDRRHGGRRHGGRRQEEEAFDEYEESRCAAYPPSHSRLEGDAPPPPLPLYG